MGAYDSVFEGPHFTNAGMMMLAGNLAVESSNSSRKKYYWEVYLLMGDPAMMVYWGIPQDAVVELADRAEPGATKIEITAPAGAYVGVTVDGQLYGAGTIGEQGFGTIDLTPLPESGDMKVVVTGKNLKPVIRDIAIAQ